MTDRTIAEIISAAVKQGKELHFSFRPLTTREKKMDLGDLCDETFGPVLDDLGLGNSFIGCWFDAGDRRKP